MSTQIIIDTTSRTLTLYTNKAAQNQYPISLGKNGLGSEENSGKTPLGKHRIFQKVGFDEPIGTVFRGRKPTGEMWKKGDPHKENLILSRILWLKGEEPGVNSGEGVDTKNRYIYIHGTNCEEALGKEDVSHGCILMSNGDIIDLFEKVDEGDYVIIN